MYVLLYIPYFLEKRRPRLHAVVNWAAKLINAGSEIDAGGGACARTYVTIYGHVRSTILQLQCRRLPLVFSLLSLYWLALHTARCLPSITSLIMLMLVQDVQVI